MKKLLPICLLLFGLTSFLSGQTRYQITPNPASGYGSIDETDAAVDATIHNLTGDTLKLHWVRNVINITPGCETAVCDAQGCYNRPVGSHDFKLFPHISKPFLVHFYNDSMPCEGIVHVKVTNNNDPADSVNVVFLFNQSTDTKDLPVANVKLYPNPATAFFSLENAENVAVIRVFSLDGRELARFEATTTNFYSIQSQPVGTYIIVLEDKNGHAFQAMELKKL